MTSCDLKRSKIHPTNSDDLVRIHFRYEKVTYLKKIKPVADTNFLKQSYVKT